MALINCEDCGTEVSDKADKCPKCACPIRQNSRSTDQSNTNETQLIEQTSKKFKLQSLIGIAIAIIALPTGYFVSSSTVSISLFTIGATIVIWTRIQVWWFHE